MKYTVDYIHTQKNTIDSVIASFNPANIANNKHSKLVNEIAKKHNLDVIIPYCSQSYRLLLKCQHGHLFTKTPNEFINNPSCKVCDGINRIRHSVDKSAHHFERCQVTPISPIKSLSSEVLFQCHKCNNIFTSSVRATSSVMYTSCPHCMRKERSPQPETLPERYVKMLEESGREVLSVNVHVETRCKKCGKISKYGIGKLMHQLDKAGKITCEVCRIAESKITKVEQIKKRFNILSQNTNGVKAQCRVCDHKFDISFKSNVNRKECLHCKEDKITKKYGKYCKTDKGYDCADCGKHWNTRHQTCTCKRHNNSALYRWIDDVGNCKIGISSSHGETAKNRIETVAKQRGTTVVDFRIILVENALKCEQILLKKTSHLKCYSDGAGWTEFRTLDKNQLKQVDDAFDLLLEEYPLVPLATKTKKLGTDEAVDWGSEERDIDLELLLEDLDLNF